MQYPLRWNAQSTLHFTSWQTCPFRHQLDFSGKHWTRASWKERKCPSLETSAKGIWTPVFSIESQTFRWATVLLPVISPRNQERIHLLENAITWLYQHTQWNSASACCRGASRMPNGTADELDCHSTPRNSKHFLLNDHGRGSVIPLEAVAWIFLTLGADYVV